LRVSHTFNAPSRSFTVGIEEELLLVEAEGHALSHTSSAVLARMGIDERAARHDIYEAQIELSSPPSSSAAQAGAALEGLRAALRETGAAAIGAGLHPAGEFGDVRIVDAARYGREAEYLQGLVRRTPDCALHVHVALPDGETAVRVCNGLREWVPLLEALAGNSPFWHGRDSGFSSARRVLRRGFPRVEIPPAFRDWEDYEEVVSAALEAGELADYTFIWWEVRPHPKLGTVEMRAMDSQSSLGHVSGLAALVQSLARHLAEAPPAPPARREVINESSYRAGRYGLDARVRHGGAVQPLGEVAEEALRLARPHARELGSDDALDEIGRILLEGNGADHQRAAHRQGGIDAVLAALAADTVAPLGQAGRRGSVRTYPTRPSTPGCGR
jgi:carboxylate-amine ligase